MNGYPQSGFHIFLTPYSEYHTLHLTGRTGSGFTVAAVPSSAGVAAGRKASDASGSFTWRVVAKRKDVKAERLARFDAPKAVKTPTVPLPKAESTVSAEPGADAESPH